MKPKDNEKSRASGNAPFDPVALDHVIRLICLDIDGTLLDSKFELRNNTRAILKRAYHEGMNIALATGRNLDSTLPIVTALEIPVSIISSGGAHIRTIDGRSIETALNPEEALEIIKIGLDNGSGLLIDYPGHSWVLGAGKYLSMYSHVIHGTPIATIPALNPSPLKISLINEKPILDQIRTVISKLYPDLQMASPFETVVDITPHNINKGNALRNLAGIMNIPLLQTAAIGDSENDLSNFDASGLAVAMGNASPEVRGAADWLAPSNDHDGVGWAVERILEWNKKN